MKIFKGIMLVALAVVVLAALASSEEKEVDSKGIVSGNNEFAVSLYKELAAEEGSVFFSPLSISSALAMTYAGAREETAEQMKAALHLLPEPSATHKEMSALLKDLNNRKFKDWVREEKDGKVRPVRKEVKAFELLIANALWGQEGYPFKKEFIETNGKYYEAGLNLVDYKNKTEEARGEINKWVEDKTNGKIKNILPEGVLDEMTRLVLSNAIYFKAKWDEDFYEGATKNDVFTLANGTEIKVPMMHQEESFRFAANEDLKAVELPYSGKEICMVVIVPHDSKKFTEFEKNLSREGLEKLLKGMSYGKVDLYMPKFKTGFECSVKKVMQKLGMQDAFVMGKADLTGVADVEGDPLFISEILHKAYIDLNEKGTEAAAATVVVATGGAAPDRKKPEVIKADRPFVYLIRDRKTGSILFMGRLMQPEGYDLVKEKDGE